MSSLNENAGEFERKRRIPYNKTECFQKSNETDVVILIIPHYSNFIL